jgi:hypothetical protein
VYEGSLFPVSSPTFVFVGVLDGSSSYGGERNLTVVLICISFLAIDGEHFFSCFLAISTSSFEKFCLVQFPTLYWSIGFGED